MVKVNFLEDDPIILAAVAARISQTPLEKGSIDELYQECRADREKSVKLVNHIMQKYNHLIFGDFLPYAITLENLSRFAAIYLWRNVSVHNLIFGAGIEASFRVIKPNRYVNTVGEYGQKALSVYQKAINLGVPEQDARYVLPEGTLTRMIFTAPPRYLLKLATALKAAPLTELQYIADSIKKWLKDRFSLTMPEEAAVSTWKFRGEGKPGTGISLNSNGQIHSISLDMAVSGSLAMYAQLVRQRQLLVEIEPLEAIVRRAVFTIPPTFPQSLKNDCIEIARIFHQKQLDLLKQGNPDFVYFLLLGQQARAMIYGKGAGVIETSRARTEGVAQWEIRNRVGIPLTRKLAQLPDIPQKQIGPLCWREGKCIEPPTFKTKKNVCRAFLHSKGKWQGSLEQLLEVLSEKFEVFSLK